MEGGRPGIGDRRGPRYNVRNHCDAPTASTGRAADQELSARATCPNSHGCQLTVRHQHGEPRAASRRLPSDYGVQSKRRLHAPVQHRATFPTGPPTPLVSGRSRRNGLRSGSPGAHGAATRFRQYVAVFATPCLRGVEPMPYSGRPDPRQGHPSCGTTDLCGAAIRTNHVGRAWPTTASGARTAAFAATGQSAILVGLIGTGSTGAGGQLTAGGRFPVRRGRAPLLILGQLRRCINATPRFRDCRRWTHLQGPSQGPVWSFHSSSCPQPDVAARARKPVVSGKVSINGKDSGSGLHRFLHRGGQEGAFGVGRQQRRLHLSPIFRWETIRWW